MERKQNIEWARVHHGERVEGGRGGEGGGDVPGNPEYCGLLHGVLKSRAS